MKLLPRHFSTKRWSIASFNLVETGSSLGLLSFKAFNQKHGVKPGDQRYILVLLLSAIAARRSLAIELYQLAYGLMLFLFTHNWELVADKYKWRFNALEYERFNLCLHLLNQAF
ncbi:MAG: hypothetical protein AAFY20_20815 [Cyanobacteria bacterium J06639_14]